MLKNTTQLEQKIESLVTLLSNTRGIPAVLEQTTPPESQCNSEPSPVPGLETIATLTTEQPCAQVLPVRNHWHSCNPSDFSYAPANPFSIYSVPSTAPAPIPPSMPDGLDLDDLLDFYREKFQPNFPFIVIPPRITATELRIQKPWLLKAVIIVACQRNRSLQLEMSRQILVEIPAAMLLRAEKSLDMLQCLVIYNAWYQNYTPVTPATSSSGMLQLALAMVYDLGLTKQYREMDSPTEILLEAIANSSPETTRKETKRSLDEIRALLACHLLTSMTTYYMKRIEVLPRTAYIVYCCKALESAAEYESDLFLVTMIRLYSFVESVANSVTNGLNASDLTAPVWMQISSLRRELDSYWASVPSHIKSNPLVLSTYNSTEVFLYRPSLHKHLFAVNGGESVGTQRLDMLYACMLSSKKLLDHSITLPSSTFLYHCILGNAHIGHSLSVLIKLTLIEEPGWDFTEIHQTADLRTYFNCFIASFDEAGRSLDGIQKTSARHSFPTGCSRVMGRVRAWYDTMAPKIVGADESEMQESDVLMGVEGFALDDFSDYLNDAYWFELVGNQGCMQGLQEQ